MSRFLVAADWNAQPDNPDRHRPRWIAHAGRLHLFSAGRGAFGDIDYVLTDATVTARRRGGRFGSDHDVVLFTVQNPETGAALRLGTWNTLAGRDPATVARTVVSIMRRYDLDVLALQEATGYHAALRAAGLDLVGISRAPGESQNPVVVRAGLWRTAGRTVKLSTRGWPLANGTLHAPIYATSVEIDGWLRAWSVHLPNYERGPWHAAAYRSAAYRIVLAARRHRVTRR
jgi:hypothetical protein